MHLSVPEREVLEAVDRCRSVGFASLGVVFERLQGDDLWKVVESLQSKGAVTVLPGQRTEIITITSSGGRALHG